MKFLILTIITIFISTACGGTQDLSSANTNSNLYESNKIVNNSTASQPRQVELPSDASEVVASIARLSQIGKSMQSLRTDEKIKECGEQMRKYKQDVAALEPKAEALAKPYSTYLGPAVIELKTCTTCSSNAIAACFRADASMADLTKRLLEK